MYFSLYDFESRNETQSNFLYKNYFCWSNKEAFKTIFDTERKTQEFKKVVKMTNGRFEL